MRSKDKEITFHFWELGGGMKLEKVLDSIITEETRKQFVIFLCFNLSKSSSIELALEWMKPVMKHFIKGFDSAFLVGTHYDEFQNQDPSTQSVIVRGLRAFVPPYGAGIIFTSNKIDQLQNRFKNVIKSMVFPDIIKPDLTLIHTSPVLVYPNEDNNPGGHEELQRFTKLLNALVAKEKAERSIQLKDPLDDQNFYEKDIDNEYNTLSKELDDGLRALQASVGTK